MTTIAENITRLQNAKSSIKTSIESKGVSVPSDTLLDGYSTLIDSIEQGGGGGGSEIEDVPHTEHTFTTFTPSVTKYTKPSDYDEKKSYVVKFLVAPSTASYNIQRYTTKTGTTTESVAILNSESTPQWLSFEFPYGWNFTTSIPTILDVDLTYYDWSNCEGNFANSKERINFTGLNKIKKLNLSSFEGYKVQIFNSMFQNCYELQELDLSMFDTSNTLNMANMCNACYMLKQIDFGDNFDTSNVMNMAYMFTYCMSLEGINVSKFNTSKVNDFEYMFNNTLISSGEIDISNFSFENLGYNGLYFMFAYSNVKYINLPNPFPLPSTIPSKGYFAFGSVFNSCDRLQYVKMILPENTIVDMGQMCNGCNNLQWIDFGENTFTSLGLSSTFTSCRCLTKINFGNMLFGTSKQILLSQFVNGCQKLKQIVFCDDALNQTNVTFGISDWQTCFNLLEIPSFILNNTDLSSSTSTAFIKFTDCYSIRKLDLSNVKVNSSVYYELTTYFHTCKSLESIKLPTMKVSNCQQAFYNCYDLKSIDLSMIDFSNCTLFNNMFNNCYNIQSVNLGTGDSKGYNYEQMFQYCKTLEDITIPFTFTYTSNTININQIFYQCSRLKTINLPNLVDCSYIQKMVSWFPYDSLQSINFPSNCRYNFTNVTQCYVNQRQKNYSTWSGSYFKDYRYLYNMTSVTTLPFYANTMCVSSGGSQDYDTVYEILKFHYDHYLNTSLTKKIYFSEIGVYVQDNEQGTLQEYVTNLTGAGYTIYNLKILPYYEE